MHPEVLIGAVAKELRAARPEVGEPGDVLLGCRGGCLVEVDSSWRHCRSPFAARCRCESLSISKYRDHHRQAAARTIPYLVAGSARDRLGISAWRAAS